MDYVESQDFQQGSSKQIDDALPLLAAPFQVNINSDKLTSTILWVTKCFQIIESHLVGQQKMLGNVTKRLELAESSQDQWTKVAALIETFGSRLDKMQADVEAQADECCASRAPRLGETVAVKDKQPQRANTKSLDGELWELLPGEIALVEEVPVADEDNFRLRSPSGLVSDFVQRELFVYKNLPVQPQMPPTEPLRDVAIDTKADVQGINVESRNCNAQAVEPSVVTERTQSKTQTTQTEASQATQTEVSQTTQTEAVDQAQAVAEAVAETSREDDYTAIENRIKEAAEQCMREEASALNEALRNVEDIVRSDVKSLTDVVDGLQQSLALSSERIDELFQNLRNSRGSAETSDSNVSPEVQALPDAPVTPPPKESDSLCRDSSIKEQNLAPKQSSSDILGKNDSGIADGKNDLCIADGKNDSGTVDRIYTKQSSSDILGKSDSGIADGMEKRHLGTDSLPCESPSPVSKPSLEVSLAEMRDSVKGELEQLRASILESVRAKIEAAAAAAANAASAAANMHKVATPQSYGSDKAMFVRTPPPGFATCVACNAPLSATQADWPREHPRAANGCFPSRGTQKAFFRVSRESLSLNEGKEDSPTAATKVTTYDLGQFIKLPALSEHFSKPAKKDLKDLPKSFGNHLQKQRSLPALQTPTLLNLGADFDRNYKMRKQARNSII